MLRLSLLLLFHSLVSEASNIEFACGTPKQSLAGVAKLRSAGARPGQDTSMLEFPWIVQILYASGTRQCAGSLISDRHVLTARRCVDKAGPSERSDAVLEAKDISVLYGTRQKYGGMMNVETVRTYDAKLEEGAARDLAVLELENAVEFSDVARPICLANTFDEKTQNTVFGLHFGTKKGPEDEEVTRSLYFDVLYASDRTNCEESLGGHFHKDEFCVSKRNQVFGEGIHIGAPIMTPNNDGGRWLQVGIALEATKENNYGSATRIDLYDEVIQELTHCYINGSGADSRQSGQKVCHPNGTASTTTTTTPTTTVHPGQSKLVPGGTKKANFKAAEEACLALHGTLPRAKTDDERRRIKEQIPVEVGAVDSRVWLLNDDPRNKSDLTQVSYVHCHALNAKDGKTSELGCEEEHAVVCEVSAETGVCDKDGDVYYKDEKDEAYCYKIVHPSYDDPVRRIGENDSIEACRAADAGEAGLVHSPQENHLVAFLHRGKYEADKRYTCLRLGVFFNVSGDHISLRQVADGSAFDFGAQPNRIVPKCKSNAGYPWCGDDPYCYESRTSLVVKFDLSNSRECWNNYPVYSCSVICKKKLH